jgi:hypothetical protein
MRAPTIKFYGGEEGKVVISNEGRVARTLKPDAYGYLFSDRPVQPNEMIRISLIQSPAVLGQISIGFTDVKPDSALNDLLSYGCVKTGKHLLKKISLGNKVIKEICFYVNSSGEVFLKINQDKEYRFFGGVTSEQVWAAVEIIGHKFHLQLLQE